MPDEHKYKNPQNTVKPMSTKYLKDHMIKWYLFQGFRDDSVYTNHSLWYITLTKWRLKTIWSLQLLQEKEQYSTAIHDKKSQQSGHGGNPVQCYKGQV